MSRTIVPGAWGVLSAVTVFTLLVGPVVAADTTSTARVAVTTATKSDSATTTAQAIQKFIGRWVRPDGGYVLEVKSIDASGKVDAAYFNPSPINVGLARIKPGTAELVVELRDVNYPGSTYNLKYDPALDRLTGSYYQAVAGETYPIYFERMK